MGPEIRSKIFKKSRPNSLKYATNNLHSSALKIVQDLFGYGINMFGGVEEPINDDFKF